MYRRFIIQSAIGRQVATYTAYRQALVGVGLAGVGQVGWDRWGWGQAGVGQVGTNNLRLSGKYRQDVL